MTDLDLSATNPFLNPGVHLWRVDKAQKKISQSSGNDQIVLEFSRVDSPLQKMKDYLPLTAGAFDSTKQKLKAFLPADFKGSYEDACFQMLGVKVYASTEISEFKGQTGLRPTRGALTHNGYQPFVEGGPAPAGYVAPADVPF